MNMLATARAAPRNPSRIETCETRHGIARFIPSPDVVERHEITINAPVHVVMDVAMNFDAQAIPAVRFVFWAREKLMGSTPGPSYRPRSLVAETRALGWETLAVRPGREYIAGAAAQPWKADVVFRPVHPAKFAEFAEPGLVKIAWTLEADPLGPDRTRFRTETRAAATDEEARRKFLRYWRWASFGIVGIRWLLLPAIRREAERRYRLEHGIHTEAYHG
jgi:hypothetical protein